MASSREQRKNCRSRTHRKRLKLSYLHPSVDRHLAWFSFCESYSKKQGYLGICIECCLRSLLEYFQSGVSGSCGGSLCSFQGTNKMTAPVQSVQFSLRAWLPLSAHQGKPKKRLSDEKTPKRGRKVMLGLPGERRQRKTEG